MATVDDVQPNTRWYSALSGRVLVVFEVDGDRVKFGYTDDTEDCGWDDRAQFADLFTLLPSTE
jgi:hypothetical protein